MLKGKISSIEEQMKKKLEEARATFDQPGDKGIHAENSFREFLKQYVPLRMRIGHGEIIDTAGRRSRQTDIVIVNEDHPFTFTPDLPGLFFIEGVCAGGEVKSILTSQQLKKSLESSCEFKQLRVHVVSPFMEARAITRSDLLRFYECPPWFLIAFESQLALSQILKKIVEFKNQNSIEPNGLLDAVFVLGRGSVINYGDGEGIFQLINEEGKSLEGWNLKNSDSVLFDFLGWLSVVMPRVTRVLPILPEYILKKG